MCLGLIFFFKIGIFYMSAFTEQKHQKSRAFEMNVLSMNSLLFSKTNIFALILLVQFVYRGSVIAFLLLPRCAHWCNVRQNGASFVLPVLIQAFMSLLSSLALLVCCSELWSY